MVWSAPGGEVESSVCSTQQICTGGEVESSVCSTQQICTGDEVESSVCSTQQIFTGDIFPLLFRKEILPESSVCP